MNSANSVIIQAHIKQEFNSTTFTCHDYTIIQWSQYTDQLKLGWQSTG